MDESVKLVGDIWPGKGHEGSTHKQVDIHMPGVSSRFWSPDLTVTPIVAKYGLLLSGMAGRSATTSKTLSAGGDLLEIEAGQALTGSAATNGTQFATKIPSLANIVSFCEKMDLREDRKDRSENQHRLIAKLIPSPLAKIEGIDSAELPTIEVEFAISRTDIAITSRSDGHFDGLIDMCRTKQTVASVDEASQTSETALAQTKHKIDEDSHLELVSIRASLKEYAVNVPLPHRYVDVQFSSKLVVEGEIQALLTNVEIKRFIDSIVTTMQRGKELRAPFTTIIPLARSMIPSAQSPSSIKIEDADLALPYFFAGFEHREPRQFRPIYEELPHDIGGIPGGWTVTDIEGGISGGRQLELSVRMDADHAVSEKERDHFVSKALRMTDFIQRVHDGGVPPLARHVKQGTNVNKTAPGVIRHVVAPALHDHTTKESEPREADHMSDVGHSTKDQEWSGFQYFNRRELDGDEEEEEGQQMTTDSRDDEPLRRQAAAMDV
ncbi:hypothetical protein ANO11243_063630 [Dothideomycetidae sp. 11243]|nr:hypothetical protein ANO11243_063630 [fungal sp. No.11243]